MYSFVSYILFNGPELFFSVIAAALIRTYHIHSVTLVFFCLFLQPLPFPSLIGMSVANKENLQAVNHSTGTTGSYKRQMVIVCLDTAFNLPVLIVALIQDITSRKANDENLPYKSLEQRAPRCRKVPIRQNRAWARSSRSPLHRGARTSGRL